MNTWGEDARQRIAARVEANAREGRQPGKVAEELAQRVLRALHDRDTGQGLTDTTWPVLLVMLSYGWNR